MDEQVVDLGVGGAAVLEARDDPLVGFDEPHAIIDFIGPVGIDNVSGIKPLEINDRKLKAYGLDKYYNAVSPSSPEALVKIFENAQLKKMPVFGYYWAPNALMASYGWQILREPPMEPGTELPDGDCGNFPVPPEGAGGVFSADCSDCGEPVYKVASMRLVKSAPEVAEMLEKMEMDLEVLNRILAWGRSQGGQDWQRTAMYFLRNFEPLWKSWVTPEAYGRIKNALSRRTGR